LNSKSLSILHKEESRIGNENQLTILEIMWAKLFQQLSELDQQIVMHILEQIGVNDAQQFILWRVNDRIDRTSN